jgi:hypothetical protein
MAFQVAVQNKTGNMSSYDIKASSGTIPAGSIAFAKAAVEI